MLDLLSGLYAAECDVCHKRKSTTELCVLHAHSDPLALAGKTMGACAECRSEFGLHPKYRITLWKDLRRA